MTVYRNKAETNWISSCRFKDANGKPKRTTKRGFGSKEEAEEWERGLKSETNIRTLTLSEFFRVYTRDIKPTVAASTWANKAVLFRDKIEPYLGATFIEELSTQDILLRQDLMRSMRRKDGFRYSPACLRKINNQLDAILNHAANFYRLERNPMKGLRKMGKKKAHEMDFLMRESLTSGAFNKTRYSRTSYFNTTTVSHKSLKTTALCLQNRFQIIDMPAQLLKNSYITFIVKSVYNPMHRIRGK